MVPALEISSIESCTNGAGATDGDRSTAPGVTLLVVLGVRLWRYEIPLPGILVVTAAPVVPAVNRNGPTPYDVLTPRGDRVSRTPGRGLKLLRNLQPTTIPP